MDNYTQIQIPTRSNLVGSHPNNHHFGRNEQHHEDIEGGPEPDGPQTVGHRGPENNTPTTLQILAGNPDVLYWDPFCEYTG